MKRRIAVEGDPIEVEVTLHQHGAVRLMIHEVTGSFLMLNKFRASEETTGFGIPRTHADTPFEALSRAKAVLDATPPEKLRSVIASFPVLNPVAPEQAHLFSP